MGKWLLAIAVFFLFSATAVHGEGLEQSYELCRLAAEQGSVKDQCTLGEMYEEGREVERNYEESCEWYRLAADQGYAQAQYLLAWMYQLGRGVEKNDKEAFKWWSLAANQGLAKAQYQLGYMYDFGIGVKRNYREALEWYKLAAEQGHVYSQYSLGWIYERGSIVKKNNKEAFRWYKLAAEQGNEDAQCSLGEMYELGRGTEQSDKEAFKWYRLAARQGGGDSYFKLLCLCQRLLVDRFPELAEIDLDGAEPEELEMIVEQLLNRSPDKEISKKVLSFICHELIDLTTLPGRAVSSILNFFDIENENGILRAHQEIDEYFGTELAENYSEELEKWDLALVVPGGKLAKAEGNIAKTVTKQAAKAAGKEGVSAATKKSGTLAAKKEAVNEASKLATKAEGRVASVEKSIPFPESGKITMPNSTIGWKVGDPINNLTKSGGVPKWSTVRQRYWKNKA
ncbi:MAG: tetratricopeptide repeat protein, partial [Chlamydiota bacterium]